MACEVPVLSSNAGGIPELNLDGVTGFVCEVGDVEDMTEKALTILDESRLPGFKERALARAKEFDIDQVLPMYVSYYERTLEKMLKIQ
jgi:glycosyltransferase involved in cell wall biosynthesis